MSHTVRRGLAALVPVLAVALVPASSDAKTLKCGKVYNFRDITAKGPTCKEAKKVVNAWSKNVPVPPEAATLQTGQTTGFKVMGYTCKNDYPAGASAEYDVHVVCTKPGKQVKFIAHYINP